MNRGVNHRASKVGVAAAALAVACAAGSGAGRGAGGGESCVVVGGPGAPVEVRIYESDPYAAPAGQRLFIGRLSRGERHTIANPHGRVWYAFRWHEGDSWREGYEASCRGGELLNVPPE
jgi:hypothetical protein